jgi:hypothetical protein
LKSFRKGGAYLASLEACVSSSKAEIVLRTRADVYDPLDRFKWMTVCQNSRSRLGLTARLHPVSTPRRLSESYALCDSRATNSTGTSSSRSCKISSRRRNALSERMKRSRRN